MFNEREFEAQLARRGIKKYVLAQRMGMSYTNLYRKIKTGRFTAEEIGKIIEIAEIDDPMPIFLPKNLRK